MVNPTFIAWSFYCKLFRCLEMMLIGSAVEANEKSQVPMTSTDGEGNDKETGVERGTYSIGQFNLLISFSFKSGLRC